MSGASNPTDLLPAGSIIDLPGNSVIEMSFSGGGNVSTSAFFRDSGILMLDTYDSTLCTCTV